MVLIPIKDRIPRLVIKIFEINTLSDKFLDGLNLCISCGIIYRYKLQKYFEEVGMMLEGEKQFHEICDIAILIFSYSKTFNPMMKYLNLL